MKRTGLKRTVTVVADIDEVTSGIPAVLELLGANVEIAPLPAGDYAVATETLVERKNVEDLQAAVLTGRFWPRIGKLRAAAARPYLLLEGKKIDRGPLHANSIRGLCLAVIEQRVALLRSDDQSDSAAWLHQLAGRAQRDHPTRDRPPYAQRRSRQRKSEAAEAVLAAVPGISSVSARALLSRFGSVGGVLAAGPDEWLSVPGIGPKRARLLEEVLSFSCQRQEKPGPST